MLYYENNDIRAYGMCSHWIKYYRDLTYKQSYNLEFNEKTYFLNYLLRLKDLYMSKLRKEDDPLAMKFYDGVVHIYYYFMDHPGYIPGIRQNTNYCFNFQYLIERTESQLTGLLTRAESEFKSQNQHFAAFFLGQYFGSKELIKICKIYLKSIC